MTKQGILVRFCILAAAVILAVGPAQAQQEDPAPSLADITEAWLNSPHGDRSSEAFTHWDADGAVPGDCAVCHTSTGLRDYLSGPMTRIGAIDHPVPTGTAVNCITCHNRPASDLSEVPFPSGVRIAMSGGSAVCSICHQGRASGSGLASDTAGLDQDAAAPSLGFVNVHYAAAAASLLGTEARVGFEYPGKVYKGRFAHVPDLNSCTACHSPHALTVQIENCTSCHQDITSPREIRISPTDFDGDGDTAEGIASTIADMHAQLEAALRRYATEVLGQPIAYAPSAYPYFFIDGDGDGRASEAEAVFPNRYQGWSPRLLKAAYNYQLVAKDPGIYVHNPHYALQLLYDSLEDLSQRVPVDLGGLTRP